MFIIPYKRIPILACVFLFCFVFFTDKTSLLHSISEEEKRSNERRSTPRIAIDVVVEWELYRVTFPIRLSRVLSILD